LGRRRGGGGCLTVELGFMRCWGGEAAASVEDLAVASPVVEPVDVFEGGELDVLEARPGTLGVDELPLLEPVEALDHRVDAPIDQDVIMRRVRGLVWRDGRS